MVCKSSLFLSWLLHKNIKGKLPIYATKGKYFFTTMVILTRIDNLQMLSVWIRFFLCMNFLILVVIHGRLSFCTVINLLGIVLSAIFKIVFVMSTSSCLNTVSQTTSVSCLYESKYSSSLLDLILVSNPLSVRFTDVVAPLREQVRYNLELDQ
jgi:hypothetical protein